MHNITNKKMILESLYNTGEIRMIKKPQCKTDYAQEVLKISISLYSFVGPANERALGDL